MSSSTRQAVQAPFDPIAAAKSTLPALRAASAAGDAARRVESASLSAIREAGLSRILAPKRFGGLELSPSAHVETCRTLAHGCSAASWVHMVCGAHTYVAGRYPTKCQEEIFGDGPDVLIPGTLAPQGSASKVHGGWLLNGRWQFGSGVDHGPWLLLGAKGVADEGADPIPPVHVFVPKCDIEVDDTWYTLGMRATGSKDIVASDVFVPEYRSLLTGRMFNGTFEGDTGPLYRLPVVGGLSSMLAGTVVGMTERGIEAFIDVTKVREDIYAGGGKAEKVGIQMRVAEAQGEIELASMLVDRNCQLLDDAMAKNEPPMSVPDQTQLQWNASYAVELCRRATERVFAVAGAHVVYDTSELQRLFRDVNTACHHAIIDFDGIREARGKLALGVR